MKPIYVISLLVAFFVGCFASQVAPLIVPSVRAGTNPTKWEYKCFREITHYIEDIEEKMKQMGQEGWNLKTAATTPQTTVYCFERELP